jgi:hypothetical protein
MSPNRSVLCVTAKLPGHARVGPMAPSVKLRSRGQSDTIDGLIAQWLSDVLFPRSRNYLKLHSREH